MALGRKTGGRQPGTPNKNNPIKGYLKEHSEAYFAKRLQLDHISGGPREIQRPRLTQDSDGNFRKVIDTIPLTDENGFPLTLSDFEADMLSLEPSERVQAELRLLKFHLPEMKAVEMDMTVADTEQTIEQRLAALSAEEEPLLPDSSE